MKLLCKNHLNLHNADGIKFYLQFPRAFLHQFVCPDNPIWQIKSWFNWWHYDKPDKNWYTKYLERRQKDEIMIAEEKKTKAIQSL